MVKRPEPKYGYRPTPNPGMEECWMCGSSGSLEDTPDGIWRNWRNCRDCGSGVSLVEPVMYNWLAIFP